MSRPERCWRRLLDRAGLGALLVWPALCVLVGVWAWAHDISGG